MARAYTAELRDRVLRACERGGLSRGAIAQLVGEGESTLYPRQQTLRPEGRREARPHAGGPAPRLDEAALDTLKELVAEANDRTPVQHAAAPPQRAGVEARGGRRGPARRARGGRGEPPDRVPGAQEARPHAQKRRCAPQSGSAPSWP